MTPDLIALVLSLPLPVRLALLDADPTGAGWMITMPGDWRLYEHPSEQERWGVENALCAWLPCNPLAIMEHARALYGYTARVRVDQPDYDEWRCSLVVPAAIRRQIRGAKTKTKMNRCPHTAAVALLREVVG